MVLKEGLQVVVGNGERVRFWEDLKWDSVPLQTAFPRMFSLSSNKEGRLHDFGRWQGLTWIWEVPLRRAVLGWEQEQWRCFMAALSCANQDFRSNPFLIWNNYVPPKAEIFVWNLLRDRVPVKEVLGRFGMDFSSNMNCSLCCKQVETVDHLFLQCEWSWNLWLEGMSWWEVSSCANQRLSQWWECWNGFCPNSKAKRAWSSLFYAIVWAVWEARNALCFEGRELSLSNAADMVKFRVGWWFKHHRKGSSEPITSILLNLRDLCVEKAKCFGVAPF
ncbi:hypothetical protein Dsin_020887 [Dipteronia sinensis]|uniref:Reverse transcriptase zinc-binding domain-containing protein n=1 Tax=Dipteronia sinensis TaxID=43782 RepID=A0AAE0AA51_9ROSI|nr:hypothetical protein Dsin_020887 [Dipteronia sinensis]